jgi:hypothetical protein
MNPPPPEIRILISGGGGFMRFKLKIYINFRRRRIKAVLIENVLLFPAAAD